MNKAATKRQVVVQHRPQKILRKLPKDLLQRMRVAIRALAEEPYPPGCKKLAGYENLWRIRVGDWRITYALETGQVVVVEIAPRGGAYRDLD
jgi:mRNA interferase RelE/StbE